MIAKRYEEDLARAYLQSVRRKIFRDEWRPLDYFSAKDYAKSPTGFLRSFKGGAQLTAQTVEDILSVPGFSVGFRNLQDDCARVAERINTAFALDGKTPDAIQGIEIYNGGFFRNRAAYLVGRMTLRTPSPHSVPLFLALDIDEDGIYVDAVLVEEADAHNIFSSTLANFHINSEHYHELSAFLHDIMPKRPLGLHYSTVGFNHIGKVAVMDELRHEHESTGEVLDTAVGFRGTVAIGFSAPSSNYVLKIIRDKPTDGYKWGTFEGIDNVLQKYSRVHDINRTGSMLDNLIFWNVKLPADWFDAELLKELLRDASETVSLRNNLVTFKHLIVQTKLIPLPVYLETASEKDAHTAIINLGHCIKNNSSANIFNKDLDGRNYGVSPFQKVYLFDYDALEVFTEVKIRTNTDRFDGEEDIPDWYFEDGVIFLPEEMDSGLRIPTMELIKLCRDVHGELMTVQYWEHLQRDLIEGKVRRIRVYPDSCKI
jgi:isocitrate dehydrogenase kinase/phosphatase